MEKWIMIIGVIMFVSGLILFYSIELGQTDHTLQFVKNAGTFMGLSGMGVTLAGILLHLLSKETPVKENVDP